MACGRMIIAALVISSSIVISSAQSQPSSQCDEAFNATFGAPGSSNCIDAYAALILGNATDQQQIIVCDEGQQCNTMIENVINLCGDMILFPTRTVQNLVCTNGPDGNNCFTLIRDDFSDPSQVIPSCYGCTEVCMQGLIQLNNSLGCCLAEALPAEVDTGGLTYTQASVIVNAFPVICGFSAFTLCNGSTLPPTKCSDATIDFFNPIDECGRAVQGILSGNESAVIGLYSGDCPMRLLNYTTVCSDFFVNDEIMQLANAIVATSEITNSNGMLCYKLLPTFATNDDFEDNCIIDFLLRRQCTSGCTQVLLNITEEYECCFNSLIGEFSGRSTDVSNQIEYTILTREIYSLCSITSGGFCNGITPPTHTNAAEQCISARNSFFTDDTCLDYYLTLGLRSLDTEVTNAASAVCTNKTCYNRMNDYLSYIQTCRLGDFGDDDDDEVDSYELVYLTNNTICMVDIGRNINCYASITTNQIYDYDNMVFAAFNEDGVCAGIPDNRCPQDCMMFLTQAYSSLGCCLGVYARVQFADVPYLEVLSSACNVPLTTQCSAITPANDTSGNGGAVTHKGLTILVGLLGMIAIVLS